MSGNPLSAIIFLFCSINFRRSLFSSSVAGFIEIVFSAIANRSGRVALHSRSKSATVGKYLSRSIHELMATHSSVGGILLSLSMYSLAVSSGNLKPGKADVSTIRFWSMGESLYCPPLCDVDDVSGSLSNAWLAFLTGSNGLILPSSLVNPCCWVWCVLSRIKLT